MRILSILLLLSTSVWVLAQSNPNPIDPFENRICQKSYEKVYIGSDLLEQKVISYAYEHLKNQLSTKSHLKIVWQKESAMGHHFEVQQFVNDIPVFQGKIKINVNNKGYIISQFDNTYNLNTDKWAALSTNDFDYKTLAKQYTDANSLTLETVVKKAIIVDANEQAHFVSQFEAAEINGTGVYQYFINPAGQVIYKRDIRRFHHEHGNHHHTTPVDSASAWIFNPDPLTSSQHTYSPPYVDNNDANSPELEAELKEVNIDVKKVGNTYFLENDYMRINDFGAPSVPPTISVEPEFHFTRDQDGFEDVNAYYHLNTYINYIENLNPDDNLFDIFIDVDTHASNGDDNSYFTGNQSGIRLFFGEGGVDDAEDADVLVHELGHAISYLSNNNNNQGGNRKDIDEGLGDYFAASYSRSISEFRWAFIFSWDGHNEFFSGRKANTNKVYPDDLADNIWANGEILSSAFMEVWDELGRETTDELVLASIANYFDGMDFNDVGMLFLQADIEINNRANCPVIVEKFVQAGLLDESAYSECEIVVDENIKLHNTENFWENAQSMIITIPEAITDAYIQLFDTSGRLLNEYEADGNSIIYADVWNHLPAGMYILHISSEELTESFKFMKHDFSTQ